MKIVVGSSNPEIKHKLEFLFQEQIENELSYIFREKGKYAIEYDEDGGVMGLVLLLANSSAPPLDWHVIDTEKMSPHQCLNRVAMIHLMSFFSSVSDFSNFQITIDDTVRCVCGGETARTTHSTWCDKHED